MKDDGVIMVSGLRDNIIDSLRGFAIVFVVIGHIISGFNKSNLLFMVGVQFPYGIYVYHIGLCSWNERTLFIRSELFLLFQEISNRIIPSVFVFFIYVLVS